MSFDPEAMLIQQEFYRIEEGARVDALRREREAERAACAALVRAAGCLSAFSNDLCWMWDPEDGRRPARDGEHDATCPQALAAAIEERK